MKKKTDPPGSFHTRMARLQEIVTALEAGTLPLEEGLALYKEGMGLSKSCREQLEKAHNEVLLCTQAGLQPFDPESTTEEREEHV